MTHSPYAATIARHQKVADAHAAQRLQAAELHVRFATARLGVCLDPGAKILDFGCGIGTSIPSLLAQGYDAFGVDVAEYWDRDFGKYPLIVEKPPPEVSGRLKVIDLHNYRLPFADGTFDFCFSDQVFEHIFDYKSTMSEIARVLKPGAISVHRFPGPNTLIEGHIHLPFPPLCFSRAYLTLWAWIALVRGVETDWRARVTRQADVMRLCNYPTKAALRRIARSAGVEISFREREEFIFRGGGRFAAMFERLRGIGMDRLAMRMASPLLSRYMVLRRSAVAA